MQADRLVFSEDEAMAGRATRARSVSLDQLRPGRPLRVGRHWLTEQGSRPGRGLTSCPETADPVPASLQKAIER